MGIAQALAVQPALLVLDEPTAMLDARTQARIIRLLASIQKGMGIGMVLINHDPEPVDRFCHSYYRLKTGRLNAVPGLYFANICQNCNKYWQIAVPPFCFASKKSLFLNHILSLVNWHGLCVFCSRYKLLVNNYSAASREVSNSKRP
jgi:energy-coupling factor transporter ATP-binding protein EcfA2